MLCQRRHEPGIQVQMQVAHLEDCHAFQRCRQVGQPHDAIHHVRMQELVVAAAVKAQQAEAKADERAAQYELGGIGARAGGKAA